MSDHSQDRVFWAEADDDALRLRDRNIAKRSLLAYLLLRKCVVLHPAYVWQSAESHRIIIDSPSPILRPPYVNIVLGDSPTVRDYIVERKSKLERGHHDARLTTEVSELQQYVRHGDNLLRESSSLDEVFVGGEGIHKISWSRDAQFRASVRRELVARATIGDSLHAIIFQNRGSVPGVRFNGIIQRLVDRTMDVEVLCSVDSIVSVLVDEGFSPLHLEPVFDRLHVLHWEAHRGQGLRVPLLSQLLDGKLDPNDPNVFWHAMAQLIGPDMERTLLALEWNDACLVVSEIVVRPEWIAFVKTYESIVDLVDNDDGEIAAESVAVKLDGEFPTLYRMIRRDGKLSKFEILGLVCGALGFATGVTALGVIGVLASLGDIIRRWGQIVHRYYSEGDRLWLRSFILRTLKARQR